MGQQFLGEGADAGVADEVEGEASRDIMSWMARNQQGIARVVLANMAGSLALELAESLLPPKSHTHPGGPPKDIIVSGGDSDDPMVRLVHRTTLRRAENLRRNGPRLDVPPEFNEPPTDNFSMSPDNAEGRAYAWKYAQLKVRTTRRRRPCAG